MAIRETSKRAKELASKEPKKKLKKVKKPVKKVKATKVKKSRLSFLKKIWLPGPLKRLGSYFAESKRELGRVTWPSRKESWRLTFAVLAFSGVFVLLTLFVDYIFKNIIQRFIL